ncbi:HD-GYP domain-containing protein [Cellulomonas xylanilytica]|uniref:HD-GYP domain-containing protein n=1 Tax=Cellulomonas xylanilytica TaxID=233583 RepID=A0A510UYZ0_9CELL|nr:HD-GYP domain-containing protein [Cellulomonas xylanilytica]GEK19868.1 hypothetical protein CXY01_03880 [Cellulomonas xylanilytica]
MAFGPTQNYDDASLGAWKAHPLLAAAVRTMIAIGPIALSVGLGLAAVTWFPPRRLGVNPWAWLVVEVLVATVVLAVATRLGRKLVPLATLLRLTLYFPDRAPSRVAAAMRHYSPTTLHGRYGNPRRRRALRPADDHAARVLGLVAAISDHDQLTRSHSERVQAYSALIAKELGMSELDATRLSWAALLHDVGKLRVPVSVLSKPGQPTTHEWAVLAQHPEAGMEVAEPLREWLGPWLDVIGQHHERWDGGGYPAGLSGERISIGARIVAVADAYDAITSARSYKRALPAAAAREELARCAGHQFDPQVVRALLAVGLGKLRRVAGPVSVLSALPVLPSFTPDLSSVLQKVTAAGALKSTGAIGLVLSASAATAGGALAGAPLAPEPPPAVPTDSAAVSTPQPPDTGATVSPVALPTPTDEAPDIVPPAPSAPEVLPPTAQPGPVPGGAGSSGPKDEKSTRDKEADAREREQEKEAREEEREMEAREREREKEAREEEQQKGMTVQDGGKGASDEGSAQGEATSE